MKTKKQKDVKGIKFRTDSEGTRSWDMTSGIRHLTANSKAFDGFIGIVQIGL